MDKNDPHAHRMNHLGALGLLATAAVHVRNGPDGDEIRDLIERCLEDAEKLRLIRYRRILNSFEIEPALPPERSGEAGA